MYGKVTVLPPKDYGSGSNVKLPDGSWLPGVDAVTQTSGLQEAINFSCGNGTVGSGDADLVVLGGEEKSGNFQTGGQVVYPHSQPIMWPALQGKSVEMGTVTLNYNGDPNLSGMVFDSCMMCDFRFKGSQVVYNGHKHAIEFKPRNPVPLDGNLYGVTAITDSYFFITTAVNISDNANGPLAAVVGWNPGQGAINNNLGFDFTEINQQNNAGNSYTMYVHNGEKSMLGNTISCSHVHNASNVGLQLGSSPNIGPNWGNTWNLRFSAKGGHSSGFVAVDTFASHQTFNITCELKTFQHGAKLQASAANNTFNSSWMGIPNPVINLANDKTSNRLHRPITRAHQKMHVSGNHFVYFNHSLEDEQLVVQDGFLTSRIMFSHDGVSFYDTAVTAGLFTLPPGAALKFNFSSPPTVRRFYNK